MALGDISMTRAAMAFLFTLCAGCATTPEPSLQELEAFDNWVYSAFSKANLHTAPSIRAIGKLLSESSVPYEAGHAEGEWSVTTYQFDGLTMVALVQDAQPQRALVSSIAIISSVWPLTNGLAVGMPVSKIKMPVPQNDKPLKYCGLNNCIEFGEDNGKISRIMLSLYAE